MQIEKMTTENSKTIKKKGIDSPVELPILFQDKSVSADKN
jgi:hypothetical protein